MLRLYWKENGKENWELLISDNCGGIAPNLLPRIFSPVVSPKPEGSGIGLALSKQLAESMEGPPTRIVRRVWDSI